MPLGEHLYQYVVDQLDLFPGNFLEIGVFNGDGFSGIAKKFAHKTCYAVDPFLEDGHTKILSGLEQGNFLLAQKQNFLNHVKDLPNVIYYEMTSVDFKNQLSESKIVELDISVVLIDGSHHYNDVVNDCELSISLLSYRKTGIIIFDDLHVEGVKRAYDEFCIRYKNNIEHFAGGNSNADYVKIQL